ncbi:MAG: hypothetical protein IPG56_11145 [Caulobacteraceae bacterium]|nr:hypothetical protein [Caulobacteraceae bacterium]
MAVLRETEFPFAQNTPTALVLMTSLLRNVAALIAAVTILQLAGGLLGVRIPIAFTDGHSRTALGLIAASYSAGFMMGAMIATVLFARVGHIRVRWLRRHLLR